MLACQTAIAIGACLADLPLGGSGEHASHLSNVPRQADMANGHEDCPTQKSAQASAQNAFAQLIQLGATAALPLELDWNHELVPNGDPVATGFRTARAGPTPLAILHCCLRN